MIPQRINFHKTYGLTERVLPNHIDTSAPTAEELVKHLILKFFSANGTWVGEENCLSTQRLRDGNRLRSAVSRRRRQVWPPSLMAASIYAKNKPLLPLKNQLQPAPLRILSLFDNAVIQRKRPTELFAYNYQIQCYVPKAKKQFGYVCLPILCNSSLVAKINAKPDRGGGCFMCLSCM